MKSFPLHIVLILVVMLVHTSVGSAEESPLTIDQAIARVQRSSALLARQSLAKALAFQPEQAGSWPDPVLSLGAISFPVDSWRSGQENMSQWQVGISQALPFPSKLGLEQAAAYALAEAANADVDEWRMQLMSRVAVHWWNIFYADRALATVSKNQDLFRQLIHVVQSKYKVGKGLQQDVLLAQLELSKLLDHELQWLNFRKQEQALLNALLNQSTPIVLPSAVDENLPSLNSETWWWQQAEKHRPLLAKHQQYITASQAKVAVAEKDFYPDFKLAASYGFRATNPATGIDRADLASLTLSMTIPWGGAQDAQLGQRKAEMAQAEFTLADIKAEVFAQVSVEIANYQRAKTQVSLFKQGIIPQAQQTLASMRAAYQVNKVDFLNLMRSQITLYNYETQYWQALMQAKQSLARLDAAVGTALESNHE